MLRVGVSEDTLGYGLNSLVKLFDRLHNIQTISVKSPEKIHKILEETKNTLLS